MSRETGRERLHHAVLKLAHVASHAVLDDMHTLGVPPQDADYRTVIPLLVYENQLEELDAVYLGACEALARPQAARRTKAHPMAQT